MLAQQAVLAWRKRTNNQKKSLIRLKSQSNHPKCQFNVLEMKVKYELCHMDYIRKET